LSEFELKLSASPQHIQKLKQALESMGQSSGAGIHALSATYYDSADLKLLHKGLSFRLRDEDGQRTQTVKSGDFANGDPLSRGEWEDAIAGDRPDLDGPETGPRLRDVVTLDELRPLFKATVRRTTIVLEPRSSTRIEAAIDEGEIHDAAGDASEALCEIELELKNGDPAAVYDVATRLLDVAPLRIETRSKAARGYGLVAANGG
jgi:inorganic triphosphatase YgiF